MEDNYRTDNKGNEQYKKSPAGLVIFIKRNGDEIYAKDKFSREYYPNTGQIAKTKDGKPIYARGPNGNIIFMKNEKKDEIYIKHDGSDYVEPNMRYAKKKDNSTYYPTIINEEGKYFEKFLRNKYAIDFYKKLFYPLDDMGHERWYEEAIEQPEEYPITNDNYYLVPQKDGKPYFMDNLKPKLIKEDIKFILERTDGSINYVTSVESRSRKSRGIKIPYERKPFGVLEDSNGNGNNKDNSDGKMEKPDKNLNDNSSNNSNENNVSEKPDKNLDDNSINNDAIDDEDNDAIDDEDNDVIDDGNNDVTDDEDSDDIDDEDGITQNHNFF